MTLNKLISILQEHSEEMGDVDVKIIFGEHEWDCGGIFDVNFNYTVEHGVRIPHVEIIADY